MPVIYQSGGGSGTTSEIVTNKLSPDTNITIPSGYCAIVTNYLAVTTSIVITIQSGGILRIL